MSLSSSALLSHSHVIPPHSTIPTQKQFVGPNFARKLRTSAAVSSLLLGDRISSGILASHQTNFNTDAGARKRNGRIVVLSTTGNSSEPFTDVRDQTLPGQRSADASSLSEGVTVSAKKVQLRQVRDGDWPERPVRDAATAVGDRGMQLEDENAEESGSSLPTMEDIVAAAAQQGVKLEVKSFGPSFEIVVSNVEGDKVYGSAHGWVIFWTKGNVLHLEKVALEPGLAKRVGNIFGAGFFVGASTLRYGLDRGCQTAELLAILDDEATHAKLVKYYGRLGFKTLYEVTEDWKYFSDRVVWGGIGTRMDADCEELLRRWSKFLKPKPKSKS